MDQGLIPHRYAKALYKVAVERDCARELYVVMTVLADSFSSEPALQEVMCNPYIKATEKRKLIYTAAGITESDASAVAGTLGDFITLLERNKRISFFRDTVLAYMDIYRKACNISTVTVVSAAPLSRDASDRLRKLIADHKPGATIEYNERVDPELIGGFKVTIDNERLDASIQNELKQLRLKMLSH